MADREAVLRPLVKSPTEFSEFGPTTSNLQDPICVFLCQEPKSQLVGTKALQYIRHGESTGVNRRNLQASGGRWYDLGEQPVADVILPIAFNDRFFVVLNDARFEVHQRFATIILDEDHKYLSHALAVLLHSSVFALAAEILGRRGLGQGALDFPPDDWRQVAIPDISQLLRQDLSRLTKLWTAIASSPPLHLADAMQDEGHKQLDRLVLKVLGLDEGLLATLHEQLQRLTASRLAKASVYELLQPTAVPVADLAPLLERRGSLPRHGYTLVQIEARFVVEKKPVSPDRTTCSAALFGKLETPESLDTHRCGDKIVNMGNILWP